MKDPIVQAGWSSFAGFRLGSGRHGW